MRKEKLKALQPANRDKIYAEIQDQSDFLGNQNESSIFDSYSEKPSNFDQKEVTFSRISSPDQNRVSKTSKPPQNPYTGSLTPEWFNSLVRLINFSQAENVRKLVNSIHESKLFATKEIDSITKRVQEQVNNIMQTKSSKEQHKAFLSSFLVERSKQIESSDYPFTAGREAGVIQLEEVPKIFEDLASNLEGNQAGLAVIEDAKQEIEMLYEIGSNADIVMKKTLAAIEGFIIPELNRRQEFYKLESAYSLVYQKWVEMEIRYRKDLTDKDCVKEMPLSLRSLLIDSNFFRKLNLTKLGDKEIDQVSGCGTDWNNLEVILKDHFTKLNEMPNKKYLIELETTFRCTQDDLSKQNCLEEREKDSLDRSGAPLQQSKEYLKLKYELEACRFEKDFLETELASLKTEIDLVKGERDELKGNLHDLSEESEIKIISLKRKIAELNDQLEPEKESLSERLVSENMIDELIGKIQILEFEVNQKSEEIEEQSLKIEALEDDIVLWENMEKEKEKSGDSKPDSNKAALKSSSSTIGPTAKKTIEKKISKALQMRIDKFQTKTNRKLDQTEDRILEMLQRVKSSVFKNQLNIMKNNFLSK